MATKGDIINGSLSLLKMNGLTVNPSPNEASIALTVLDDFIGQLSATMNVPYNYPATYGQSDPADISGLSPQMTGAIKKALTIEIADHFGKPVTRPLVKTADQGMKALRNLLVKVGKSQNPPTLPIGSGNQYDYRGNKFYNEPKLDDGAIELLLTDTFNLDINWGGWLPEEALTGVTYVNDSGIALENQTFSDSTSQVKVSFTKNGVFKLCVTGSKGVTPNNVEQTERYLYSITSC